jgi:hypothetical protein
VHSGGGDCDLMTGGHAECNVRATPQIPAGSAD